MLVCQSRSSPFSRPNKLVLHYIRFKKLVRDKCSSLLGAIVSYEACTLHLAGNACRDNKFNSLGQIVSYEKMKCCE